MAGRLALNSPGHGESWLAAGRIPDDFIDPINFIQPVCEAEKYRFRTFAIAHLLGLPVVYFQDYYLP